MSELVAAPLQWQKSSKCTGGNCVQVAKAGGSVAVRDSKSPDAVLFYTPREWDDFLEGIKRNDFEAS